MKAFKKKFQELVYSFSTEDRYADYDEEAAHPNVAAEVERSISHSNHGSQIQLADYVDGSNPSGNEGISEALLAWRHIDNWTEEHNPDLAATLSDPCTRHDINNAEKDLDIIFPASVRASLRIHDGQEDLQSMTGTGGLLFGLQLMSLDQIVQMSRTWRNVAENLQRKNEEMQLRIDKQQQLNGTTVDLPSQQQKGYGKLETQDYKAMDPNLQRNISQNYSKQFKLPDIPNQHSVPPLAIQPVYAHSGWIPLVTDNAGNHIGIDLAPGPKGKYGQVILFGREFDTKFVVANNWGDFLLSFANDLELGNWLLVDEDNDQFAGEGELVFRDKKTNGPIRDYLEVLVMRSRMKYNSYGEKKLPKTPNQQAQAQATSSQESQSTFDITQQETSLTVDETNRDSEAPSPTAVAAAAGTVVEQVNSIDNDADSSSSVKKAEHISAVESPSTDIQDASVSNLTKEESVVEPKTEVKDDTEVKDEPKTEVESKEDEPKPEANVNTDAKVDTDVNSEGENEGEATAKSNAAEKTPESVSNSKEDSAASDTKDGAENTGNEPSISNDVEDLKDDFENVAL
ncbi:KNR4/SMI1 homolog [Kluyveromyces marxianus DMKU3-1042]|uniref:KNR4/SMI1 homolog n=1 Tax=Kluyveromyces marxianus (strain DMKU3-1042 / BCC 29191 / NBRC 104275) TaxID=1003335 RepID=W0TDC2_KLUMD|nr:uncharacterized protein KLMA_60054 [Kluyveromyces marxianus DMKU3-1042]BAO41345.1 KNR4/SMI1 homolog [Kluyveromyces marxianus DMKU3-1042]